MNAHSSFPVARSWPLVAYVAGIGLRGPGLAGWTSSRDILGGRAPHVVEPTVLVAPAALPPAERRRVGKGVKIALEVGFEAVAHAGRDAAALASIFTSSSGDGDNCDALCRELAGDRMISPTRFHNSVHNAPSGYWGIASGSMSPSTSLCAFDDSFVAGLDDALTQLACGADAVLLVAYDAPYPEPLATARPTPDSFGVGLVLTREPDVHAMARIEWQARTTSHHSTSHHTTPHHTTPHHTLAHHTTREATRLAIATLEHCRMNIPAARALPLLSAIARGVDHDELVFDRGHGSTIALNVSSLASHALPSRRAACA